MGETRVDLLHLLEDLRDAYPGSTEETILTEIVANALDSGATTVSLASDAPGRSLTIVDDGEGMRRRELARYHDIAASSKVRGAGIGFAGVGIKIALLVCDEVVTETRRGRHHVASSWRLMSRHKAVWRWTPPAGLVQGHGTAVRLQSSNPLSPLLDPGFIEGSLRRHFQPLLDPGLTEILSARYPRGVAFVLNGDRLAPERWPATELAPISVRLSRKRRPAAAGYLVRDGLVPTEDRRGIAISTHGKIIRRGWEWLGLTPLAPDRVGGVIEAPALAECLTLNKADFIRSGPRGATYLAYRKAIQEAVSRQLAAWGDAREPEDHARRRAARPVERDLESVLADLAADFPLLATLVEQRAGGQRRLPVAAASAQGTLTAAVPATLASEPAAAPFAEADGTRADAGGAPASEQSGDSAAAGGAGGNGAVPGTAGAPAARPDAGQGSAAGPETHAGTEGETGREPAPAEGHLALATRRRAPARYGLAIQFEPRPDDPELARLVESTVWVNEAHPAYRRAVASRSEGYHVALSAAMALAPLAVEPAGEHGFVTAFLASWGEALGRRRPRRGRPPRRR